MRTRAVLSLLAGALLVAGCLSGQTGSPKCEFRGARCVCPELESGTVVRGRVTDTSEGFYRLTVDEVWRDESGVVQPGTDVVANDAEPLSLSCLGGTLQPNVGDEVLAVFYVPLQDLSGSAGEVRIGGIRMIQYAPRIDFGNSTSIDAEELPSLVDPETCWDRLPNPPCDDTEETTTCTVGAHPGPPHGWATLFAGAVVASWLRRSRRPRAL